MKPARLLNTVFVAVLSIFVAAIVLLPILWGVVVSLKTRVDALSMPPQWLFTPMFENYRAAFVDGPYAQTMINSLTIAVSSSILAMVIGVPAAYAFPLTFRGSEAAFLGILEVSNGSSDRHCSAVISDLYQNWPIRHLCVKSQTVYAAVNVALVIWVMKGFIDEVPVQIDEASLLDGDSRFSAMLKQVLPVCAPGLLVMQSFALSIRGTNSLLH